MPNCSKVNSELGKPEWRQDYRCKKEEWSVTLEMKELAKSAVVVRDAYDRLNVQTGKSQWTATEYAQGLVGDVGDLMKLVMAHNGFRDAHNLEQRLAHELCDCLWSILILAGEYEVDLEKEFPARMDAIISRIQNPGSR